MQALFDLGWLPFIGIWAVPAVQCIALAVVIFQDRRPAPLFPRWAAYFNLWVAALFVPGVLIVFFKSGPFAWDGLFCWWIPAVAFFGWIVVMTRLSLKAIPRT